MFSAPSSCLVRDSSAAVTEIKVAQVVSVVLARTRDQAEITGETTLSAMSLCSFIKDRLCAVALHHPVSILKGRQFVRRFIASYARVGFDVFYPDVPLLRVSSRYSSRSLVASAWLALFCLLFGIVLPVAMLMAYALSTRNCHPHISPLSLRRFHPKSFGGGEHVREAILRKGDRTAGPT